MIRLAQQLESAPDKLRGGDGNQISNQRPIAEKASREFSEDVRRFIRVYGETIPRHSFVDLLESCMAVGLFKTLTSLSEILFAWEESGNIQELTQQRPAYLLVDCSNGVAPCLKTLSEQSFDDFMRRIEHLPVILMALRLLDQWAHSDPKIKKLEVNTRPYATEWINLLGDILLSLDVKSSAIFYDLELKAADLAEGLHDDHPEAAKILQKSTDVPNPVWRLAESLTLLQGRKNIQTHLKELFDSIL
ncbi:MAG: hypothetical protein IPI28_19425 [Candidatus Omnitrophica bacterium]|nr:hypothetical protein [Candidatus Omnitrophota bacterium]